MVARALGVVEHEQYDDWWTRYSLRERYGEVDVPAPTRVSGTGFYQTVRNLPGIRGIYGDAEKEAFDVYRLTGEIGRRVVDVLRSLHTGVLEVYVTWVVVGVAAVVALLFLLL